MQYKIFIIPIKTIIESEDELNRFLRGHRVLSIQKEFVSERENSFWTFVVEYIEQTPSQNQCSEGKSKIDYKQILSEDEFMIFSKLREFRKELAVKESIPVYAVFTNEQLAEMVRRKIRTRPDIMKINGIGEAKIEKYGAVLIEKLCQWFKTDRITQ